MEDTVTNARWQKVTKEWKTVDKYDKNNEKVINNSENMTANVGKDALHSISLYEKVGSESLWQSFYVVSKDLGKSFFFAHRLALHPGLRQGDGWEVCFHRSISASRSTETEYVGPQKCKADPAP